MDTSTLLENIARLKKLNENNSKNLLKLGIDPNALPNNLQYKIKEFVDIQKETGLHDLNLMNLEAWHLNKKVEAHTLEQDILKPLQRKVRNINNELVEEEKKIKTLNESITFFKSEMIADDEFDKRTHDIALVIAEAENAIAETPLPPIELDCDDLIYKINAVKMGKKLKSKGNGKKY